MMRDTEHWFSEGEAVGKVFRTKNVLVHGYRGPAGSWRSMKGVISNTTHHFS